MTLTEALAPYRIKGSDGHLPVTSDRVAVEFDVMGGKRYFSRVVLEAGDDLFFKIEKPWGDRPMSIEFETGGDVPMSIDLTPETARDLAVCLDWAARQANAPLPG